MLAYLAKSTDNRVSLSQRLILFLPLGLSAGMMAHWQADYLVSASRHIFDWLALGGLAIVGWMGLFALPALVITGSAYAKKWASISTWTLAIAAFIGTSLLIADGRYRDFPISLLLLPCLQFGLVMQVIGSQLGRFPLDYIKLVTVLMIGNIILLLIEPLNTDAWAWFALSALLLLASGRHRAQPLATENPNS
jgi:hypothetical protein